MDRDIALRIDGMLIAIRGNLDGVAYYVKNNCTEAEFKRIARQIGATMADTIEISNALYQEHPDIVPREQKPTTPKWLVTSLGSTARTDWRPRPCRHRDRAHPCSRPCPSSLRARSAPRASPPHP